jgi:hypothetical protein
MPANLANQPREWLEIFPILIQPRPSMRASEILKAAVDLDKN